MLNDAGNEERLVGRRRFLRRTGSAALVCLATPVIVACTMLAASEENRFTVEMTDLKRFKPSTITIPVGGTIVWKNTSKLRHSSTTLPDAIEDPDKVMVPQGAESWNSGALYNGQVWDHTFTVPGTYRYVCQYHANEGMIGIITVEE